MYLHVADETLANCEQDMEVSCLKINSALFFPILTTFDRTRVDKVNAELVTLTYGTIVAQLCRDFDSDYAEVNRQLDRMGHNIGVRLIEDFLAKSNIGQCANFRETAEMISKVRRLFVSLLIFAYL